jgi:hypothetical protein
MNIIISIYQKAKLEKQRRGIREISFERLSTPISSPKRRMSYKRVSGKRGQAHDVSAKTVHTTHENLQLSEKSARWVTK